MNSETFDPRTLPGAVSIRNAVKALEFFLFDNPETGLAYSKCPLGDHVLRVKAISPGLVDLFCEGGCSSTELAEWVNAASVPEPAE